jgi:2-polyprenyl-3-methyl-5-hydroxy-6-metoxy-1,4-benzoquinol methylase
MPVVSGQLAMNPPNGSPPLWTGERLITDVHNETKVEHLHRYAIALSFARDQSVLDIASGEGYGANLLAGVAKNVMGVDIDGPAIAHASKKYARANLTYLQGSAIQIPCESHSFDLVVSFETIEHIEEHDAMMRELKRVLKPGGLLLISSPEKQTYSDTTRFENEFHKKELYLAEFEELIGAHFLNRRMVFQRMMYCSIMTAGGDPGEAHPLTAYSGGFEKVEAGPLAGFSYNLALCSDSEIRHPGISVFNADEVLKGIRKERYKVLESKTYRVGDTILSPFRKVMSLLGK